MGLGWEHAGVYIVCVFCLGNIGFISPTHVKCPNVKWSLLWSSSLSIIYVHPPSISLSLILYSRSWCSLTWEWVVTINCTIMVSLVEVDGWLNIHAFLLWFYFQYFLLLFAFVPHLFHINALFTILVLFNLRMGGYNCTILASLVEVDGWLNIHAFLLFISNICFYYLLSCPFYFSHFNSLFTILVLFNLRMGGYNKLYDPGVSCWGRWVVEYPCFPIMILFTIFSLIIIICFHPPAISLTLILYSRSWCSLTWEWVVTIVRSWCLLLR